MQRDQRRLEREDARQQQCGDAQQPLIVGTDRGDAQPHLRHVERAGQRIEQPQRDQEQRRADDVDHHILHPRLEPRGTLPVDHQPVGGDQQYLEEHEQVEQIAGQERAVEAEQLELEQRMEMPAVAVGSCQHGVEQREQRQHGGQHQHDRGQPVGNQQDTEGRFPAAQFVGPDHPVARLHHQRERGCQHGEARNEGNRDAEPAPSPHHQQRQRRRQRGDHDRRDGEVRGEIEREVHEASSSGSSDGAPST